MWAKDLDAYRIEVMSGAQKQQDVWPNKKETAVAVLSNALEMSTTLRVAMRAQMHSIKSPTTILQSYGAWRWSALLKTKHFGDSERSSANELLAMTYAPPSNRGKNGGRENQRGNASGICNNCNPKSVVYLFHDQMLRHLWSKLLAGDSS